MFCKQLLPSIKYRNVLVLISFHHSEWRDDSWVGLISCKLPCSGKFSWGPNFVLCYLQLNCVFNFRSVHFTQENLDPTNISRYTVLKRSMTGTLAHWHADWSLNVLVHARKLVILISCWVNWCYHKVCARTVTVETYELPPLEIWQWKEAMPPLAVVPEVFSL